MKTMKWIIVFLLLLPFVIAACGSSSSTKYGESDGETKPVEEVQPDQAETEPEPAFVNPYADFPDVTWKTFWCVYFYNKEWRVTTYSFGETQVRWLEEFTENPADLKYYGDYRIEDGLLMFNHFKYGEQWLSITAEEADRYQLCWKYSKTNLVESYPCEMQEFFFFDVSDAEAFLEEQEEEPEGDSDEE